MLSTVWLILSHCESDKLKIAISLSMSNMNSVITPGYLLGLESWSEIEYLKIEVMILNSALMITAEFCIWNHLMSLLTKHDQMQGAKSTLLSKYVSGRSRAKAKSGSKVFPTFTAAWLQRKRQIPGPLIFRFTWCTSIQGRLLWILDSHPRAIHLRLPSHHHSPSSCHTLSFNFLPSDFKASVKVAFIVISWINVRVERWVVSFGISNRLVV